MNLESCNKIYFIGIGGIGISAVARILHQQGKTVLGSDAARSEITEQLEAEGIKVFSPQQARNISEDIDLAIYSVAVPEDNVERMKAKRLEIPQITYPQLLGELMKGRYGIGVSGTNGKTTTTAMIGLIFLKAGLDPTIVIGGKTSHFGGNSRVGQGQYFIFESDEYRRAFDNYSPQAAVVTYIAADHLDYYKNLDDIKKAFHDYLARVPRDGFIIINTDDPNSLEAAANSQAKNITFGIEQAADYQAKNIKQESGRQTFDLYAQGKTMGEISLQIPARYNIYNALAAVALALSLGIDFKIVRKTLDEFSGTWRRFEKLGRLGRAIIIADYAHTPDAVAKTIAATREFYPNKSILAVFQPHQYNRTKNFFNDFVLSLGAADEIIVPDIFYVKGRENPADFDVSSEKLAAAIKERGLAARAGGDLTATEK